LSQEKNLKVTSFITGTKLKGFRMQSITEFPKKTLAMAVFFSLLISCGSPNGSAVDGIIGSDDRTSLSKEQSHANLVGSIRIDDQHICSGYISAVDEVTSAAHCTLATVSKERYKFVAAKEEVYQLSDITYLDDSTGVVRFSAKVKGEFIVQAELSLDKEATAIGYSLDKDEYTASTGRFYDSGFPGLFLHDIDTVPGMSGSPILQDSKVVAVHIGYSQILNTNIAVALVGLEDVDLTRIDFKEEDFGRLIRQMLKSSPVEKDRHEKASDYLGYKTGPKSDHELNREMHREHREREAIRHSQDRGHRDYCKRGC
jgi:hypothetical protein